MNVIEHPVLHQDQWASLRSFELVVLDNEKSTNTQREENKKEYASLAHLMGTDTMMLEYESNERQKQVGKEV
jgi:hypothetical protein